MTHDHQPRTLAIAVGATATLAATAAFAAALAAGQTAAGASTTSRVAFSGTAYGSTVALGSAVHSGKTAKVPLCTMSVGASHSDKTAAVTLPELGTIGAVTTRMASARHKSTVEAISSTHTATTSLFAGAISADAISAQATVARSSGHYRTVGTSTFAGLTIAGQAMPAHPAVDQTVALPMIGTVVLNHHSVSTAHGAHTLTVTAAQITVVAGNSAGLPAGKIVIGHASAALHSPSHHLTHGSAYGTAVQLGGAASSGHTAPAFLPCGGGSATDTNSTASVSVPGALTTKAVSSRVKNSDSTTSTSVVASSTIADVNLDSGAVKVGSVVAVARATRTHGHLARSAKGTQLSGLVVQGNHESAPAPGTKQTVPGLGTLYFGSVTKHGSSIQVYALRLVVTTAQGGLTKGTVITVGSARAEVDK